MGERRVLGWVASSLLFVALVGCSQPGPIDGRGYVQVFADQFDYASQAEMGEVWELYSPFTPPPTPESITFRTDASTGARYVRLTTGEFRGWEWTSIASAGARRDSPEPNYPSMRAWRGGYFEARIRYSANEWTWPAFWLFSQAKTENWPDVVCPPLAPLNAEWDILDSGRFDSTPWTRDHYHGAVHRNTPAANGAWCGVADERRLYDEAPLAGMDLTQWHVWAGRWVERWDGTTQLCNYVDEIEIGCQQGYDTTVQPMVVNIMVQGNGQVVCTGCTPPAGSPNAWLDVDWVRVSQLE